MFVQGKAIEQIIQAKGKEKDVAQTLSIGL